MYYVLLHWQTCVLNIEKNDNTSVVRQNTLIFRIQYIKTCPNSLFSLKKMYLDCFKDIFTVKTNNTD